MRPTAQPHEMEDDEPSMKLSNAFIVVLALHFVAVGGIYAFNSFKARHPAAFEEPLVAQVTPATGLATVKSTSSDAGAAKKHVGGSESVANTAFVDSGSASAKAATKVNALVAKADAPKVAETALKTSATKKMPKDSGVIHVVAKGENPVIIARRLGVNYEDLLALNHIEDPRKLKVGQKLHIPVKAKPSSN